MKKLLIAVAIGEELKVVKKLLEGKKLNKECPHTLWEGTIDGYPVDVLMTSMGMDASKKAALEVVDPTRHGGVLVLGYCGGLSLTLRIGDAVIASHVMGPEPGQKLEMDTELGEVLGKIHCREGLNYRRVPMITQGLVIETPDDKKKLFDSTNAEAVDMETYQIMCAAVDKNLRTAVIKVVIDDVETELPKFNDYFNKVGKMDNLNVTPVLISAPALSLKLSKYMKIAGQVLEKSIPHVIPAVCAHWNIEKSL